MDLSEIEDGYKRSLEIAEKKFIDDVKPGANIKKIEAEYKKSTQKSRALYNEQLSKFLKTDKSNYLVRKVSKKEEKKIFLADTSSYDLNFYQRTKGRIALSLFKIGFYLKNSFKKATPSYALYLYFRLKIKAIRFYDIVMDPLKAALYYVLDLIARAKLKFKEITHTKS